MKKRTKKIAELRKEHFQVSGTRPVKEKNSVRKKRALQTGFSFNRPPASLQPKRKAFFSKAGN